MLLIDEHFPRPHGPLARLADTLGTAIAGDTAPTGFRLYVADTLVRRARGVLLFDENGRPTPVPDRVLKGLTVPRGVSNLRVIEDGDRTTYAFSRHIEFGAFGLTVTKRASSQLTFAEGAS